MGSDAAGWVWDVLYRRWNYLYSSADVVPDQPQGQRSESDMQGGTLVCCCSSPLTHPWGQTASWNSLQFPHIVKSSREEKRGDLWPLLAAYLPPSSENSSIRLFVLRSCLILGNFFHLLKMTTMSQWGSKWKTVNVPLNTTVIKKWLLCCQMMSFHISSSVSIFSCLVRHIFLCFFFVTVCEFVCLSVTHFVSHLRCVAPLCGHFVSLCGQFTCPYAKLGCSRAHYEPF